MKMYHIRPYLKIENINPIAINEAIRKITSPTSEKPITGMGIPLSVCNISDEPIISDDIIRAKVILLI